MALKKGGSGGPRDIPKKPTKGGTGKGLIPDDYVYANEVAYQPAYDRAGAVQKMQAKIDLAYLKKKYPYIRKEYAVTGETVVKINKTYP